MARLWIGTAVVVLALGAVAADDADKTEPSAPSRPAVSTSAGRSIFSPGSRTVVPNPGTSPSRALPSTPSPGGESGMRTPAAAVPVVPAKEGEHQHARTVLRLHAVPAIDVANTINQLLTAEGNAPEARGVPRSVVIVPDAISNSLVIGGPPDAIDEVRQLVAELDHPALMVQVEAAILEVPAEQAKSDKGASQAEDQKRPGKARILAPGEMPEHGELLAHAQLTTLDNQRAFVQMGRREPRITNSQISQNVRINSTTLENVGSILGLTPRVGTDQTVTMTIDVEDSRMGPPEEGTVIMVPKEGEPIRSPIIHTAIIHRVAPGGFPPGAPTDPNVRN
jgi:type II secretory pathway component GspD/PulD (secretin)